MLFMQAEKRMHFQRQLRLFLIWSKSFFYPTLISTQPQTQLIIKLTNKSYPSNSPHATQLTISNKLDYSQMMNKPQYSIELHWGILFHKIDNTGKTALQ